MSLIRLIVIIITFARYRLDNLIKTKTLSLGKKIFLGILPWRYFIACNLPRGVRIRKSLETLGPVFVKFGQILSTRKDLIPDDISIELAKLQDKVPPFAGILAQQIIIENFKEVAQDPEQIITTLFAEFNPEPLASASVAQVHAAKLHTGEEVIVKIIRPNIKKTILQDIKLLLLCGKILSLIFPETKKLHLIKVILDYKQTILNELNLLQEAANAAQLRHNFRASDILYIPKIYWEYTKESVLVMERIYGVPVTDVDSLTAKGVDMKKVATRGVEIFFTQVFRDSFFHADMHPGNIWLDITNPAEPKYLGLDFGIVGSLDPEDQYYLAGNLLAFFKRDYRKVAQLHIKSGWVPANTKINELETAIRTVCEPIFGRPLKQISFGMLLVRLFQVARKFNMELQPQLVLLEKTLLNIEGLGRQLCPDLNLWDTALPFLENWIQKKVSYDVLKQQIQQQGLDFIINAPILSQKLSGFITDCNKIKNFSLLQQQNKQKTNKLRKKVSCLLIATGAFVSYSMTNLELLLPYLAIGSSLFGLLLLFYSFSN